MVCIEYDQYYRYGKFSCRTGISQKLLTAIGKPAKLVWGLTSHECADLRSCYKTFYAGFTEDDSLFATGERNQS